MTLSNILVLLLMVGLGVLFVALVGQCRRPTWWLGRITVQAMNSRHRELTTWGLSHVIIGHEGTILDVGCGGGKTVQELATQVPLGRVCGVDFASASVATAWTTNTAQIQAGRVIISKGNVMALPFADSAFDVVTAFETHYYWPNLVAALKEIRRVLCPEGTVLLCAESYRRHGSDRGEAFVMRFLGGQIFTADQHKEALIEAGFAHTEVFEEPKRGWVCAVGRAPNLPPLQEEGLEAV